MRTALEDHKENTLYEAEKAIPNHWLAMVILEWVRVNGSISAEVVAEHVEMDYLGIHDWSEYKADHRRTV